MWPSDNMKVCDLLIFGDISENNRICDIFISGQLYQIFLFSKEKLSLINILLNNIKMNYFAYVKS